MNFTIFFVPLHVIYKCDCIYKRFSVETNIITEEMQKQVDQLKNWINTQPDLPNLEDKLLIKFVHSCYYDVERAKRAIDLFFSIRSSAPEVLTNRDPLSPGIQKAFKLVNLAKYKISGNRNLWIWQCNDPGLEHYEYVQDVKLFYLKTDAWLLDDLDLEESNIAIFDVKLLTLKFISKFNVFVARKLSKYQQEALPVRIKGIHVLNCPTFIDKLFGLMKPFLKQEIIDMVHFHTPGSETIYKYFSKNELPEELGGTRGTMTEHMKNLVALITSKREYFVDEYSLWKKDKNSKNKMEIASFRSLDID